MSLVPGQLGASSPFIWLLCVNEDDVLVHWENGRIRGRAEKRNTLRPTYFVALTNSSEADTAECSQSG